jgi:hypothetical protein
MRKIVLLSLLVLSTCLLGLIVAQAQTALVINPREVEFDPSPDHAAIDRYVIAFYAPGSTTPARELDIGKPAVGTDGKCRAPINVQPLTFTAGYTARVRGAAGTILGEWSDPSNPFDRIPGKAGGVVVR